MSVKFCPIASGSNGNCIFVGVGDTKILIDAGLSGKRVELGLNSIGETCKDIDGIFITHEHSDHIMGAGILSRKYDIPLFATYGTWDIIEKNNMIGEVKAKNKRFVYSEENLYLNDICVHPFTVPHDSCDPVGYCVSSFDKKICIATDIGHITHSIVDNIKDSDIILVESNHDVTMVEEGRYPYMLKKRVLGDYGHLSNVSAAELLSIAFSKKLKHVILGHLSDENNNPVLAYETVLNYLETKLIPVNKSFNLQIASRYEIGKLIEL